MTTFRKLSKYAREFSTKLQKTSNMRNLGTAKYVASKRRICRLKVSARDVENRHDSKYDALEGKLEISYSKETRVRQISYQSAKTKLPLQSNISLKSLVDIHWHLH